MDRLEAASVGNSQHQHDPASIERQDSKQRHSPLLTLFPEGRTKKAVASERRPDLTPNRIHAGSVCHATLRLADAAARACRREIALRQNCFLTSPPSGQQIDVDTFDLGYLVSRGKACRNQRNPSLGLRGQCLPISHEGHNLLPNFAVA